MSNQIINPKGGCIPRIKENCRSFNFARLPTREANKKVYNLFLLDVQHTQQEIPYRGISIVTKGPKAFLIGLQQEHKGMEQFCGPR